MSDPLSSLPMPRKHHYMFAYAVVPGFAFSDPRSALGLAVKSGRMDVLGELWSNTLKQCSAREREQPTGEITNLDQHALLLVTMPCPIKITEAYFIGIVYPQRWLNDQGAFHSSDPKLRVFVLAMSSATEVPDTGTLREIVDVNKHHAVSYGVHADRVTFTNAILELIQQPPSAEVPSYFLSVSGDTQGPYTWGEVLQRMKDLPQDALLWHPNVNEWRSLRGMPLI